MMDSSWCRLRGARAAVAALSRRVVEGSAVRVVMFPNPSKTFEESKRDQLFSKSTLNVQ